jgi:hypothetical protein
MGVGSEPDSPAPKESRMTFIIKVECENKTEREALFMALNNLHDNHAMPHVTLVVDGVPLNDRNLWLETAEAYAIAAALETVADSYDALRAAAR